MGRRPKDSKPTPAKKVQAAKPAPEKRGRPKKDTPSPKPEKSKAAKPTTAEKSGKSTRPRARKKTVIYAPAISSSGDDRTFLTLTGPTERIDVEFCAGITPDGHLMTQLGALDTVTDFVFDISKGMQFTARSSGGTHYFAISAASISTIVTTPQPKN